MAPDEFVALVEAFPCATMSIGAWTGPVDPGVRYGSDDIERRLALTDQLCAAGARRVAVAARWDLITDEFVDAMAEHRAIVDVWNSTTVASPADPVNATLRLRNHYGDALGAIHLRD